MSLAGCQIIPIDLNFHLQKCLENFDKNSADKIQSKNYKGGGVNPPCLMPIRVKGQVLWDKSLTWKLLLCFWSIFSNQNKLRILVFLTSIWPNVKEYIPSQDLNSKDLNFNILKWQKELLSAYKGTLLQTKQIKLKLQTITYNFYTEKHGNVAIIGQLNYFY